MEYTKNGTVASCEGAFANNQGVVEVCKECRACEATGVALDCSNILPDATSTKCYVVIGDDAPTGNRFLFPTGGNGTLTIGDPNGIPYNQDNTSGTAPMAGGSIQMMLVGVITAFIVLVGL